MNNRNQQNNAPTAKLYEVDKPYTPRDWLRTIALFALLGTAYGAGLYTASGYGAAVILAPAATVGGTGLAWAIFTLVAAVWRRLKGGASCKI